MTSHGGSLAGNTLHSTTITEVHVGVVVEEVIAGLVEGGSSLSLGNGQTDGVGETLAERTGGDLNTGGVVSLGVTGGDAVELLFFWSECGLPGQVRNSTYTEVLQVIHANGVAKEVKESILEHATVTVPDLVSYNSFPAIETQNRKKNVRENKTIPVNPVGVLGVEAHELVEEDVGDGGHAHRGTGVTGVGLEGGIDLRYPSACVQVGCRMIDRAYRKSTDRVDSQLVQVGVTHDGGSGGNSC